MNFKLRKVFLLILITFWIFCELKFVLAGKTPLKKCDVCEKTSYNSKKDRFYCVNFDREIVRQCFGIVRSREENSLSLCSSCTRALNKHKKNAKCFTEVSF